LSDNGDVHYPKSTIAAGDFNGDGLIKGHRQSEVFLGTTAAATTGRVQSFAV
jgi:hypothetical protein